MNQQRRRVVIVPVQALDEAAARALDYARTIGDAITAVHMSMDFAETAGLLRQWQRWTGDIPLVVLQSAAPSFAGAILHYLDQAEGLEAGAQVTVLLSGPDGGGWRRTLRSHRQALRLRAALLNRPSVSVRRMPGRFGAPLRPFAAVDSDHSG